MNRLVMPIRLNLHSAKWHSFERIGWKFLIPKFSYYNLLLSFMFCVDWLGMSLEVVILRIWK